MGEVKADKRKSTQGETPAPAAAEATPAEAAPAPEVPDAAAAPAA